VSTAVYFLSDVLERRRDFDPLGGQARGAIAVADTVKPSATAAAVALRGLGLRTILLTGDNQATADAVAAEAGIGEVIAGAMPDGKVAVIGDLQAQGRFGGHGW